MANTTKTGITYIEYRPGKWAKIVDGTWTGPAPDDELNAWLARPWGSPEYVTPDEPPPAATPLPSPAAVREGLGVGDIAVHDLGLRVRVVGAPRIILPGVDRLLCEVLDPARTGLVRGQHYTFRADRLLPA